MSRCELVVVHHRRLKKWWCRVEVTVMESDSNLKSWDDERELCGDFSARGSKVDLCFWFLLATLHHKNRHYFDWSIVGGSTFGIAN